MQIKPISILVLIVSALSILIYSQANNIEITKEMRLVESGSFIMGCKNGNEDESPVHQVEVSDFYISKYEVTNKQFIFFLNSIGASKDGFYKTKNLIDLQPDIPINYKDGFYFQKNDIFRNIATPAARITWFGAIYFCNWLSKIDSLNPVYEIKNDTVICNWQLNGYRLPTEAEWEYAARGGRKSKNYKFAGSNSPYEVGWFYNQSGGRPHKVGTKNPNELGIYDMAGNVYEWCWDWYDKKYYSKSKVINPKGPKNGETRVLRGVAYEHNEHYLRISNRDHNRPEDSFTYSGFRIARSVK